MPPRAILRDLGNLAKGNGVFGPLVLPFQYNQPSAQLSRRARARDHKGDKHMGKEGGPKTAP